MDPGWPETGAAKLRTSDLLRCVIWLRFMVAGDPEAGLDRGWPETGAAKLRTPDLSRYVIWPWFMVTGLEFML